MRIQGRRAFEKGRFPVNQHHTCSGQQNKKNNEIEKEKSEKSKLNQREVWRAVNHFRFDPRLIGSKSEPFQISKSKGKKPNFQQYKLSCQAHQTIFDVQPTQ